MAYSQQQSTAFESQARLARSNTLNTIMEDKRGERRAEKVQHKEIDPATYRESLYASDQSSIGANSPAPSLTSSISSYYFDRRSADFSDSALSDNDSEFAPSLLTDISSVRSMSPDQSPPSHHKTQKYPILAIPSPSFWPSVPRPPPSQLPPRPPKIPLSPANLSLLGYDLPRASNPPSLAGSLSTDPNTTYSGPSTPDSASHPRAGEFWGGLDDGTHGKAGKSIKPKIRIDTQVYGGSAPGSNIDTYDFAAPEFQDSPILGSDDGAIDTGVGVALPFEALMTLRHLSLDAPPACDNLQIEEAPEMQETSSPIQSPALSASPSTPLSEYSISQLSIPSPGDFFASLGGNARNTWHIGSVPASALPPSSTTAEQFYKCPWNMTSVAPPPLPTNYFFELDGTALEGLDIPNAPKSIGDGALVRRRSKLGSLYIYPDHLQEEYSSPLINEQEDDYEKAIQEAMEKNVDRTSDWLSMQTAYLASLRESNPLNDLSSTAECELRRHSSALLKDSPSTPIRKAVRFLDTETAKHEHRPVAEESVYYHAFQHIRSSYRKSDAFTHRLTRSDSIQSVRLCLPHEHVKRVKGEYHLDQPDRPVPHRPISLMPGKEDPTVEESAEQLTIRRVERERQALEQMNARAWVVEANKYLQGGQLLSSPARWRTIKTPKLGDIHNGRVRNPARVLDLGGLPHGDWAWHCAKEYPHAKVFTVTTSADLIDAGIRGPHNHRRMHVKNLWNLPFPDGHFHAISARNLHAHLKVSAVSAMAEDEYDATLKECLRVLKPGGYLEFDLMDAEIVHPFPDRVGPLATKTSVEFAFRLRARGYDAQPSKRWLGRLREAGFDDIKRAWTFMPVGSPTESSTPEFVSSSSVSSAGAGAGAGFGLTTAGSGSSGFDAASQTDGAGRKVEAVRGPVGSTRDVSHVSGLVGSWAWEQWMMKLGSGNEGMLEEVAGVLEEGKSTGAGWRCLRGWARKPFENVEGGFRDV